MLMLTTLKVCACVAAALATGDLVVYALALAALVATATAYVVLKTDAPAAAQPRAPRRLRPPGRGISVPPMRVLESTNGHNGTGVSAMGAVLREKGGQGREYELGLEPAVIGASSSTCTIVLDGDGIAPEHARIWLRQRRYLLHHVGGLSRKTYVSGQEADWVILETGDEVTIGPHRLVFEDLRPVYEDEKPAAVAPGVREQALDDDLSRMEAAVRELWAEALPASETAVGERSGLGKYKVHRKKDELAERVGGHWVKRGRTVVLER
jgi:hypothetical protein